MEMMKNTNVHSPLWAFLRKVLGRARTVMGTLLQGQLVPGPFCPCSRDIAHPGRSQEEQIQPGMPLEGPWASGMWDWELATIPHR